MKGKPAFRGKGAQGTTPKPKPSKRQGLPEAKPKRLMAYQLFQKLAREERYRKLGGTEGFVSFVSSQPPGHLHGTALFQVVHSISSGLSGTASQMCDGVACVPVGMWGMVSVSGDPLEQMCARQHRRLAAHTAACGGSYLVIYIPAYLPGTQQQQLFWPPNIPHLVVEAHLITHDAAGTG